MFEELRDLANTIREHAPEVVAELRRAVDALDSIACSLESPAVSRDQLTIDQEVTK